MRSTAADASRKLYLNMFVLVTNLKNKCKNYYTKLKNIIKIYNEGSSYQKIKK